MNSSGFSKRGSPLRLIFVLYCVVQSALCEEDLKCTFYSDNNGDPISQPSLTSQILSSKYFTLFGAKGSNNLPSNNIYEYDIDAHRWSVAHIASGNPLLSGLSSVIGNRDGSEVVYIINPVSESCNQNQVFVYSRQKGLHPINEANSTSASAFRSTGGYTVVYGEKTARLYVFGGVGADSVLIPNIYYMDLNANGPKEWKIMTSVSSRTPMGSAYHTSFLSDNKMYIFGGRSYIESEPSWVFNFDNLKWSEIEFAFPLMKHKRFRSAGVYAKSINSFLLQGGESIFGDSTFDDLWSFDASTELWTEIPLRSKDPKCAGLFRSLHTIAWNPDQQELYSFGGHEVSAPALVSYGKIQGDKETIETIEIENDEQEFTMMNFVDEIRVGDEVKIVGDDVLRFYFSRDASNSTNTTNPNSTYTSINLNDTASYILSATWNPINGTVINGDLLQSDLCPPILNGTANGSTPITTSAMTTGFLPENATLNYTDILSCTNYSTLLVPNFNDSRANHSLVFYGFINVKLNRDKIDINDVVLWQLHFTYGAMKLLNNWRLFVYLPAIKKNGEISIFTNSTPGKIQTVSLTFNSSQFKFADAVYDGDQMVFVLLNQQYGTNLTLNDSNPLYFTDFRILTQRKGKSAGLSKAVIGGVVGGAVGAIIIASIVVVVLYYKYYKKRTEDELRQEAYEAELKNLIKEVKDVEVGRKLGGGNFGEVYQGTMTGGTTTVALKRLKKKMVDESFVLEATILQKARHPNCILFIGLYTHPETQDKYLVTEYCSNGSILDYLDNKRGQLTANELIHMGLGAAVGMAYLEKENIVHCDLSARNLLVDGNGTVKVADFGLARPNNKKEMTIDFEKDKFPIRWSPPEVLRTPRKFSSKSDTWSMGIALYEIVTYGRIPYAGLTNEEVTKKVLEEKYRMPRPAECPENFWPIITSCWTEDPEQRPTLTQIAQNISKYLGLTPSDKPTEDTIAINPMGHTADNYAESTYSGESNPTATKYKPLTNVVAKKIDDDEDGNYASPPSQQPAKVTEHYNTRTANGIESGSRTAYGPIANDRADYQNSGSNYQTGNKTHYAPLSPGQSRNDEESAYAEPSSFPPKGQEPLYENSEPSPNKRASAIKKQPSENNEELYIITPAQSALKDSSSSSEDEGLYQTSPAVKKDKKDKKPAKPAKKVDSSEDEGLYQTSPAIKKDKPKKVESEDEGLYQTSPAIKKADDKKPKKVESDEDEGLYQTSPALKKPDPSQIKMQVVKPKPDEDEGLYQTGPYNNQKKPEEESLYVNEHFIKKDDKKDGKKEKKPEEESLYVNEKFIEKKDEKKEKKEKKNEKDEEPEGLYSNEKFIPKKNNHTGTLYSNDEDWGTGITLNKK